MYTSSRIFLDTAIGMVSSRLSFSVVMDIGWLLVNIDICRLPVLLLCTAFLSYWIRHSVPERDAIHTDVTVGYQRGTQQDLVVLCVCSVIYGLRIPSWKADNLNHFPS